MKRQISRSGRIQIRGRAILSKRNRKAQLDCDAAIYKQRNVIEWVFCRFKDLRYFAMHFSRIIKGFMATIAIAATVICWL